MSEEAGQRVRAGVLVWQWGQRGAGPRFAAELAASLQAEGRDVTLSLSRHAESYGSLSTLCRKRLDFAGRKPGASGVATLLRLPFELLLILGRLRADRPRAAICAMVSYWDILFVPLLRVLGTRVIVIVHEVEGHPGDTHPKLYAVQRFVVRLSHAVVTLSEFVGRHAAALWPEKLLVQNFHPPFSFSDLDLAAAVAPKTPAKPLLVLLTGRIWLYKGGRMALEAFRQLPPGIARLRVAGGGIDLRQERLPADVEIENRWLSEAELVAEIDAADVVLFPYLEASQSGLVPICLSRGRPVVATPSGGLAEQVRDGENGILLKKATSADIAEAIDALASAPGRLAKMGVNAVRGASPGNLWSAFANRIAHLLD